MLTQILTGLALIGGISFLILKMKKKNSDRKEQVKKATNNLTIKEKELVDVAIEILGIKWIDVVVVRTHKQKIPQYGNKTWFEVEDKVVATKAGAFYDGDVIFIKRFDRDTYEQESLERFLKLYIHEAIHSMGHIHGEEMNQFEIEKTGKIIKELSIRKIRY